MTGYNFGDEQWRKKQASKKKHIQCDTAHSRYPLAVMLLLHFVKNVNQ